MKDNRVAVKNGIIIALTLTVLIAVGITVWFQFGKPIMEDQKRIEEYNRGAEAIEKGEYEKARDIFTKLGNFDNSREMLAYAKKGITFEQAKQDVKNGEYRKAKETLEGLGGFKDSASYIVECDRAIAYEEGAALLKEEKYKEAYDRLLEAGSFPGAETALKECRTVLSAEEVKEAVAARRFSDALRILESAAGADIPDREALLPEVKTGVRYEEAVKLFNDQMYYSAMEEFERLGDFLDSQSYLNRCVQTKPSTRETYHNSAYSGASVSMIIKPPTNDGTCTYFKIYAKNGSEEILVLSAFIAKGGSITVKFPAGSYVFKAAYGDGEWYGEKEMFGDEGYYDRLKSSDTSDIFTISTGSYELTLRSKTGSGNVGTRTEKRDGF